MNMHVTEGSNRFCGPAALSVITGSTVDHCAYIIGTVLGKTPDKIKGVPVTDFIKAADKLRVKCNKIDTYGNSLFGTIHYLISSKQQGKFLIVLEEHYVVVEIEDKQVFLCDNHTKTAIKAESSARLSQKVIEVYKTEPQPAPIFVGSSVEVELLKGIGLKVHIKMSVVFKFKDESDNYKMDIGNIKCDKNQLSQVVNELAKLVPLV